MKLLSGKKTYLTAAAGIIGAVAAVANGNIEIAEAAHVVVDCLLVAFLRAGVKKTEK